MLRMSVKLTRVTIVVLPNTLYDNIMIAATAAVMHNFSNVEIAII